jgi:hypothetical protein
MDTTLNLEFDLFDSSNIVKKCKDDIYAQHLYSILCNNVFIKNGHKWSCSWRAAGGIVADIRHCEEDYLDWYCSGITQNPTFVPEGFVSNMVYPDIKNLGWIIHQDENED